MTPVRVVADTNIYISALMFGGLPGIVLDLGLNRAFQLVASRELLEELDEKLRGKFGVNPENAGAIQTKLRGAVSMVLPEFALDVVQDDPDDNRVLECAMEGRAQVIVTGDRHLLRLEKYEGIPILTAREFLMSIGWRE